MTYVLERHCNMCLDLSSVVVKSSSVISADDYTSLFHDHTETDTTPSTFIAECFQQHENIALSLSHLLVCLLNYVDACLLLLFMGMQFRNHVIQSRLWSQRGTKRDTATIAIIFLMLEQNSALPQCEDDLMTPHLLNLVHVAVRSRFEGPQTYGHTRIYVYIRK